MDKIPSNQDKKIAELEERIDELEGELQARYKIPKYGYKNYLS